MAITRVGLLSAEDQIRDASGTVMYEQAKVVAIAQDHDRSEWGCSIYPYANRESFPKSQFEGWLCKSILFEVDDDGVLGAEIFEIHGAGTWWQFKSMGWVRGFADELRGEQRRWMAKHLRKGFSEDPRQIPGRCQSDPNGKHDIEVLMMRGQAIQKRDLADEKRDSSSNDFSLGLGAEGKTSANLQVQAMGKTEGEAHANYGLAGGGVKGSHAHQNANAASAEQGVRGDGKIQYKSARASERAVGESVADAINGDVCVVLYCKNCFCTRSVRVNP